MKVTVSIDANNVLKAKDDTYWCDTLHGYSFWERYLNMFDDVVGAVRVGHKNETDNTTVNRVDGEHVEICEFPMAKGIKSYIKNYPGIIKSAKKAVAESDVAIIRLPSATGFQVFEAALKNKMPIALEVVANPYEAYKPSKIARILYSAWLHRATRKANGVSYVTSEYLQKEYPCRAIKEGESDRFFTTHYSSVDLDDDFYGTPKVYEKKNKWTIVHTANGIHNHLKGHDTVIKALKIVRDRGFNVSVIFVGDGRIRNVFEKLSAETGVGDAVSFTGLIADRTELRSILIKSDIFVLPTHTEGLPRSVIEAMAVGLPCISTPVGGIPELLADEYMLPPTDEMAFAEKIIYMIKNPCVMTGQSKRNIERVQEYSHNNLTKKRNDYFSKLRRLAEKGRS